MTCLFLNWFSGLQINCHFATRAILGSFPCDRCMHMLSIPEIHPLCYNYKAYNLLIYNWLCQTRKGISESNFGSKHYTQSTVILYNVYGHGTVLSQELNWCQWKSVAHSPRSLAETKHIGIMSWSVRSSPKHYWHVTLRLYIIAKRTAMDSQPLFPQLSMLYVHTCIKQMTLWR